MTRKPGGRICQQAAARRKTYRAALRASEALFRKVLESLPVGVAVANAQGAIIHSNARFAEIWGGAQHVGIEGYGIYQGWWAGTRVPLQAEDWAMARAIRNGETSVNELIEIACFDGTRKIITNTAVPLYDEHRHLTGGLVVIQDVTEHRQAEAALHESQTMLRLVLDNIPQRVFWKDRGLVYQGGNKSFLQDKHLDSIQALVGKTDYDISPRTAAELYRANDLEVMRANRPRIGIEEPNILPDGTVRWDRVSKVPLTGLTGAVIGLLGTYEDITAQKQAEAALRQSEERFRTAVENLLDGFAILVAVRDAGGQIVDFTYAYINQIGSQMNHLSQEAHRGRTLLEVLVDDRTRSMFNHFVRVVETGAPLMREILFYEDNTDDQQLRRAYDVRAVKLDDGFAVIWRDVTERKRAEALMAEHNHHLALLSRAGHIFIATLEVDTVVQRMLELLTPEIAATSAFWQVDPAQGDLRCARATGPGAEALLETRVSLGAGPVGWAAEHHRRAQRGAILAVPVLSNNTLIGVVELIDPSPGAFPERRVALVESLVLLAAVAMENARLYAEVEQLSILDELTGAYNRRGFYLLAEQLMKQSTRSGKPLLLIYLDADNFKQINDRFGHAAGDQALRGLVQQFKSTFRASDLIARMGGDEFAILLPVESAEESAAAVARLRCNMRQAPMEIILSIGQAEWNPLAPGALDALIARADADMYVEKQRHKQHGAAQG